MKSKAIYKSLILLVIATLSFVACTKETSDVRLDQKLSTSQVLNVTAESATVVGFVIAEGDGFSERGVCYAKTAAPTTASGKVIFDEEVNKATYSVTIAGLDSVTKYYARAYAIADAGTIYGEEVSFTTIADLPVVTTDVFTTTSGTSATGGGEVTLEGGAEVSERGVCYAKTHDPTTADGKAIATGTGPGVFTSSLTNLKGLTTYYVRAYAINSAGTAYGNEVSFTTPEAIVTLYAAGDFQGWDPAGAKDSLMNSSDDPVVQGYAYISTTGGFKFVSQRNWDGPNYGAGATAGTLSNDAGAGNLSVSEIGYYFFTIDLVNLTYTATKTTWGMIGDATAGGWGADQTMTYSIPLRKWFATVPLTVNSFKFRANAGWDINYGDNTPADGKLDFKSDNNIPVAAAGTYTAMMDLSSPLNYTYALTQWSITGAATGGWGVDIDLTPNVNNTWTVTADLTAGEFKFRANHDWPIALGGTVDNLTFKGGAPNLSIATAGNYTITLDLITGKCTITAN